MSEWLDLSLGFEGHWAILALLPLLTALVYLIYRRTYPAAASGMRAALVALRSLALGLLLLLLLEPVLGVWSKEVVRPRLLVLVDTSASMAVAEAGGRRLERAVAVLSHEDFRAAVAAAELSAFGFAQDIHALDLDTLAALRPAGSATDLAGALRASAKGKSDPGAFEGILLVSDGAHNLGEDPLPWAAGAEMPVYALGVGSGENPPDIRIAGAEAPESSYVGRSFELQAEIRNWGYGGRDVQVLLLEGEREIDRRRLALQQENAVQRLSFEVEPKTAGPHIYRLEVPPLEGEFWRDNNEALVFTRVLEERTRVSLMAGEPSVDLAFLQRGLKADSSIVVDALVQRQPGVFYQEGPAAAEKFDAADVVVLLNPDGELMRRVEAWGLAQRVLAGTGLLFIGGPRASGDWDAAASVAALLPVAVEPRPGPFVSAQVPLRLSAEGRRHPVVRLQQEEGQDPWKSLPPLPGYFPIDGRRPGSLVLVEVADEGRAPLVVAGVRGRGKVVAALSASWWRLDLLSSGVGGQPQTIRRFWRNAVKWLALENPSGRLRVSTERHVYRAGERIVFVARAFDELLRPQRQAQVRVLLNRRELRLQEQAGGSYRGSWGGLEPGDYHYKAEARVGDVVIGVDEGRFLVEQHSVESVDVRADLALLNEIARRSGGQYRPLDQWRQLLPLLPLQKRLVEEAATWRLWGSSWPLVLAVVLLGIEWGAAQKGRDDLVPAGANPRELGRRCIPSRGIALVRRTLQVRLAQAPCDPGAPAAQFCQPASATGHW